MVRIQKSPKGYTLKLVPTGGLSAIRAIYHSQPSQRRPRSSCLDVPGSGPSCARAHAQQKTLPMLARLHVGRGGELTLQDFKKKKKGTPTKCGYFSRIYRMFSPLSGKGRKDRCSVPARARAPRVPLDPELCGGKEQRAQRYPDANLQRPRDAPSWAQRNHPKTTRDA